MKCPHCAARVGLFSDAAKTIAKDKACPHCGRPVEMGVRFLPFTAGFAAVAVAALVAGVSGPVSAGVAGGVGAIAGFGLKKRAGGGS